MASYTSQIAVMRASVLIKFFVGELARLVQNRQGNVGLAQVVQQTGQRCQAGAVVIHAELACQRRHQRAHRHRMHIGVFVGSFQARQADQSPRVARHGIGNLVHLRLHAGHVHSAAHARLGEHRHHRLFGAAAHLRGMAQLGIHGGGLGALRRQFNRGRGRAGLQGAQGGFEGLPLRADFRFDLGTGHALCAGRYVAPACRVDPHLLDGGVENAL